MQSLGFQVIKARKGAEHLKPKDAPVVHGSDSKRVEPVTPIKVKQRVEAVVAAATAADGEIDLRTPPKRRSSRTRPTARRESPRPLSNRLSAILSAVAAEPGTVLVPPTAHPLPATSPEVQAEASPRAEHASVVAPVPAAVTERSRGSDVVEQRAASPPSPPVVSPEKRQKVPTSSPLRLTTTIGGRPPVLPLPSTGTTTTMAEDMTVSRTHVGVAELIAPKSPGKIPRVATRPETAVVSPPSTGAPGVLPARYELYYDMFCSLDVAVAMTKASLGPNFDRLRTHVQGQLNRNFNAAILSQLMAVDPDAFTVSHIQVDRVWRLMVKAKDLSPEQHRAQLEERKTRFLKRLTATVQSMQDKYLEEKFLVNFRNGSWHPSFMTADGPALPSAELPAPPGQAPVTTKELLNLADRKVSATVAAALELLNKPPPTPVTNVEPDQKILAGLRGLPDDLIEQVRKRKREAEARNAAPVQQAKQELDRQSHLPLVIDLIVSQFHQEQKNSLIETRLLHGLVASFPHPTSLEAMRGYLSQLLELAPDWLSVSTLSTGLKVVKMSPGVPAKQVRDRVKNTATC